MYVATIRLPDPEVRRLSSEKYKVSRIAGAACGKCIWDVGGASGGPLRTISYPDMKLRQHPKATLVDSGWLVLSPDGETLAYETRTESGFSICLEDLQSGQTRLFPRRGELVFRPAWSPDGRMIAFDSDLLEAGSATRLGAMSLKVIDVSSGEVREIGGASLATRRRLETRDRPVWLGNSAGVLFEARYEGDPPGRFVYQASVRGDQKPIRLTHGFCTSASEGTAFVQDYVSKDDHGIYAVKLGEPDAKRTCLVTGFVWLPTVSPSGRILAYYEDTALKIRFLDKPAKEVTIMEGIHQSAVYESYWVRRGEDAIPK
jgi:hypothetical protein